MDNFDLRKYLAEGRLLKEEVYVDFEDDLSEVTVYGFGQQFTGVETSDGKYYFIHYFDDVDGDDSVPFLFNHLKKIGGKMEIDEEEITLEIDYDDLRPLINENKLLKEFVSKELEDRNEPLYDKLVPGNGDAETLEGEMLRAINRIIYRYFNSGDKYYEGYGTETAGPAHSFLVNANHPLKAMMNRLFREFISDDEYEKMLNEVLEAILTHIESKQGEYTKNTLGGIFKYEPEFEDMEEDDDDYTYDYDDEYDDDDYYQ